MKKLSALDTWFTRENATAFQHLVNVMVFEPDGPPITMDLVRSITAERLHLLPLTRQRLVEVPLGLGEPYWVQDPDFELSNHLVEATLPAPGDDRALAAYAARLASRQLDRSRPLWDLHLVDGLQGGRQALMMRFHHASVDGGSGMDVTGILLDPTAKIRRYVGDGWTPERVPSGAELVARAVADLPLRPVRMLGVGRRLLGRVPKIVPALGKTLPQLPRSLPAVGTSSMRRVWEEGPPVQGPATLAPRTRLNHLITANREVVFETFSVTELKAIKSAFGVTLNDVVVAACAGAVREWLQAHDVLPHVPTIVNVPVSTRTDEQRGDFGNRVSMLIAQFPTHIADPLARLEAASGSMRAAKERNEALGRDMLAEWGELMMPSLVARANRATGRTDMPVLVWNVAVTNVPGPREDLFFAGRRLESIKPVGFLLDDLALMLAFISYRDQITLGVLSCPDLVPDAAMLAHGVRRELEELAALAHIPIGRPALAVAPQAKER
jgi:diacylglycerol O-acyltransferase / wax synthase